MSTAGKLPNRQRVPGIDKNPFSRHAERREQLHLYSVGSDWPDRIPESEEKARTHTCPNRAPSDTIDRYLPRDFVQSA